jgi:hypothetical protein
MCSSSMAHHLEELATEAAGVNFIQHTGKGECLMHGPYSNPEGRCPAWPKCIGNNIVCAVCGKEQMLIAGDDCCRFCKSQYYIPMWKKEEKMKDYITQEEYLALFKIECDEELALTERKNKDYAGSNDAMANFRAVEQLTNGRISLEDAIYVRMTDKFKRVGSLLDGHNPAVKDEAITDTLRDLSVYAKILKIIISHKNKNEHKRAYPVAYSGSNIDR